MTYTCRLLARVSPLSRWRSFLKKCNAYGQTLWFPSKIIVINCRFYTKIHLFAQPSPTAAEKKKMVHIDEEPGLAMSTKKPDLLFLLTFLSQFWTSYLGEVEARRLVASFCGICSPPRVCSHKCGSTNMYQHGHGARLCHVCALCSFHQASRDKALAL